MTDNVVSCAKCGKEVPLGESVSVKGSEVPEFAEEKELKSDADIILCGLCYKEMPQEESPDFGSLWG